MIVTSNRVKMTVCDDIDAVFFVKNRRETGATRRRECKCFHFPEKHKDQVCKSGPLHMEDSCVYIFFKEEYTTYSDFVLKEVARERKQKIDRRPKILSLQ